MNTYVFTQLLMAPDAGDPEHLQLRLTSTQTQRQRQRQRHLQSTLWAQDTHTLSERGWHIEIKFCFKINMYNQDGMPHKSQADPQWPIHNTIISFPRQLTIIPIVAFHSFLVWLGCDSSLASQNSACPISLNLGGQSNSVLCLVSLVRSWFWPTGRSRKKENWC